MSYELNQRACRLTEEIRDRAADLHIVEHQLDGGGTLLDCGVDAPGGLDAGLALARVCLSGLAEVSIVPGEIDGIGWPQVAVRTDHPTAACLLSQYAGWQIAVGDYFGMGSGPVRAASAVEELFEQLDYREQPDRCVGVLESRQRPGDDVIEWIASKTGIPASGTLLLVAPTASPAGNLQIVARTVETALHKLFELGFDVNRIESGIGTAPLPPAAADDLEGIGRTNDAILYGGRVFLSVRGDDEELADVGAEVPSSASDAHGRTFLEIFKEVEGDFYAIDPLLFSPAEIVLQNLDSGRVHRFGRTEPGILKKSFGL